MDNKFKVFVIVALIILALLAGTGTFIALNVLNKSEATGQSKEVDDENIELIELGEAITANLLDEMENPHIIRLKISFAVDSKSDEYKKFNEDFALKQVLIRDMIIRITREQTYEMMMRQDAQSKLSDEIVASINKLLGTTLIQKVYFGDFFVQ